MNMDFEGVKKIVQDRSALIIDVRNPDEVASMGAIPTAVNIPRKYPAAQSMSPPTF